MSTNNNEESELTSYEVNHTHISDMKVDSTASRKSQVVFTLGLLGFAIPLLPSIASLLLYPTAKAEVDASNGKLRGYKMLKWGKRLSWIGIGINIAGAIMLAAILYFGNDLLVQACNLDSSQAICSYISY
jgi:hypothetical protein